MSTGRWTALLLPLVVGGCAGEYPQSTIDPASEFAAIIHSLYVSVFWWTMLILVVVWGVLAYVLIRYRRREGDAVPRQFRGHLGMEIAWTVVPALIVLAIAIPTIRAVFATQRPISEDALLIEVTGHRFWWEFNYPELGIRTANELHLPVDRPVGLRLSASDVVHSFWVPTLGGKRDLNPLVAVREGESAYTWLQFTPLESGVFMGQCAEFCGQAHAFMGMRVVVQPEPEFNAWSSRWLAGDVGAVSAVPLPEDPLVTRGRQVFLTESTCIVCHSVSGTPAQGRIGPDLTLFGSRTTLGAGRLANTPENLALWIRDPQGVKPGAEMPGTAYPLDGGTGPLPTWPATGLGEEQLAAVVAYLSSLR